MHSLNLCKNFIRLRFTDTLSSRKLVFNKTFCLKATLTSQASKSQFNNQENNKKRIFSNESSGSGVAWYASSAIVLMIGLTYAAVPLYKMFCEAQGIDIKDSSELSDEKLKQKIASLKKNENRVIKVKFLANRSGDLLWKFEPMQSEINLAIGETSLAFYKAKNLSKRPITGIATYNILPFEAGLYFNKIQCFCFEEQRLEPGEEVDMPVFFYLDDQFGNDPLLENVDSICLSYTFFESKGSISLEKELPLIPRKFLQ